MITKWRDSVNTPKLVWRQLCNCEWFLHRGLIVRDQHNFYNFSFHSEWSRWLSDGQGPARRQEEGTRPWQVQVSLPGWLFELTLVGGANIELCICRTTLRISNQQTSSSREHCWSFKPAASSAPTYPAFRLAVVQNKLLGPVIYRQIYNIVERLSIW